MNFFRRFMAAWRASFRYTPEAEAEQFWTPSDAAWLENSLKTYSGQKLKMRLDNFVINRAADSLKQLNRPNYDCHCAEANGIRIGVQAIYEHLPLSPASAHDASEESKQEDTLDSLEPVVS